MVRSGATQWRLSCPHLDKRASERAMHSQVSRRNHGYFISEDRVACDVSEDDLEMWLTQAEEDGGALVVCNHCRRISIANRDDYDRIEVHPGSLRRNHNSSECAECQAVNQSAGGGYR